MDGLERANLKNEILEFLVTNRMLYDTGELYKTIENDLKSKAYFVEIVVEMLGEAPKYLDESSARGMGGSILISSNEFTQEFLDKGGFVTLYSERQKEVQKLLLEREEETNDILIQRVKNRYQAKLAKWQVWIFWPMFVLGAVGGGYSIYQIAVKIFNPTEVVTKQEFKQFKEELAKPVKSIKDTIK